MNRHQRRRAAKLEVQEGKRHPVVDLKRSPDYRRGYDEGAKKQQEVFKQWFDKFLAEKIVLSRLELHLFIAISSFDDHVYLAEGETLIKALKTYRQGIEKTYSAFRDQLIADGEDVDPFLSEVYTMVKPRLDAVDQALKTYAETGELDPGALTALRHMAQNKDPNKKGIWEIEQQRRAAEAERAEREKAELAEQAAESARQEAEQAERNKHIRKDVEPKQQLRERAKQALIDVKPERPNWSWGRLRNHYLSKWQGRENEMSPESREVYQYLRSIAPSTLSELMGGV